MDKAVAIMLGVPIAVLGPTGTVSAQTANQRFVLVFLKEEPDKVVAAGTIRALERSSTRGGGRVLLPGGRKPAVPPAVTVSVLRGTGSVTLPQEAAA